MDHGQVNQLVTLGVLLQLMAICTQSHFPYFYLVAECLWNKSSLQNDEAIVQTDVLAADTSLVLRLAIFIYLALPIGLGVAYKGFTGGTTVSAQELDTGLFGLTGQPGTTGIGTSRLALFYNATSPWWTNPALSGV